ncbi:uncharacterized protein LOC124437877 [Xenia sp. Carnegie-2017]|uniref:uncharacterized protein LOC124437877 n=1 Tax=Xenia sp. Carnegie-2017 TaxID=2897299 RepID=UPI001F040FBB|nr:uncharacterized protein LOC124437877 [Xenia sp. Carnegie-2017]
MNGKTEHKQWYNRPLPKPQSEPFLEICDAKMYFKETISNPTVLSNLAIMPNEENVDMFRDTRIQPKIKQSQGLRFLNSDVRINNHIVLIANESKFFKGRCLTKDYKIKESVHKKLESFSWLCGDYGVARPTNQMPYLHLFLEVDQSKNDNKLLKQEIDEIFKWNASKYIELRFINPSNEIIIYPLSKMVQSRRDDASKPSCGTLTLFCCKDGKHYALTCLHTGYKNSPESENKFLYIQDEINNNKMDFEKFMHENKYSYIHNDGRQIALGEFSHYSFDQETDIMAILFDNKEIEFTAPKIEMPSSLENVFKLLSERENDEVQTPVYKAGDEVGGSIVDLNRTVRYKGKIVFRDVVAVESDHEFIQQSDSGSLVYFSDKNNKKIPFAYAVAVASRKNKKYYACLRLKDALDKLGLLQNACFCV